MKRFISVVCGLAVGLFWTWLCVYTLSHADLPPPKAILGCRIEDCAAWWLAPAMLANFLLPAVGFAVVGYLAASRGWPVRKTAIAVGVLMAGTALVFALPYIV